MYKSFRVQNFRGFRDLQLDDLARVNLIAGKNNSGKTSLLEALFIHSGEYNASRLLRVPATRFYRPRLREGWLSYRKDSNIPSWNILFHNFEVEKSISLAGEYEDHRFHQAKLFEEAGDELLISTVDPTEIPDDSWILRHLGGEFDFGLVALEQIEVLQFKSAGDAPFHMAQIMGSIISDRRSEISRSTSVSAIFLASNDQVSLEDDAARFTDLKRERKQKWFLEALNSLEPRLQGLELFYDGDPPIIHGDLDSLKYALPISSMGEGMRRITSLLLAISSIPYGIVFIDEIENGLHHSVQIDVWKAIAKAAKAYKVQIFATTHSLEMIRAAHKAYLELETENYNFRLHRLDRSVKTGEIKPTTYNEFSMSAAIDLEAEVRG